MIFFDFFKLLQNARKLSQMVSEVFPGLETVYFHPRTPPLLIRKNFFKTDFGTLRRCFCLYELEKAWKTIIFEAHNSNFLGLTMRPQNVSDEFEIVQGNV